MFNSTTNTIQDGIHLSIFTNSLLLQNISPASCQAQTSQI